MKVTWPAMALLTLVFAGLTSAAWGFEIPEVVSPTQTQHITAQVGDTVTFTVSLAEAPNETNGTKLQWYFGPENRGYALFPLSGETGLTLTVSINSMDQQAGWYYLACSNAKGGDFSPYFKLKVSSVYTSTAVYVDDFDRKVEIKPAVVGVDTNTTYRWQWSSSQNGVYTDIVDATSLNYIIPLVIRENIGYYRLVLSQGSVTSFEVIPTRVSWLDEGSVSSGNLLLHDNWVSLGHYWRFGGWIWHLPTESFWYTDGSTTDSVFFWNKELGWVWTTAEFWPWMYRFEADGGNGAWEWFIADPASSPEDKTVLWFWSQEEGWIGREAPL